MEFPSTISVINSDSQFPSASRCLCAFDSLDYRHQPLNQQLDSGVRQIELDVYSDSKGGLYSHPSGPAMIAAAQLPSDPEFDPDGIMAKPGFKVRSEEHTSE